MLAKYVRSLYKVSNVGHVGTIPGRAACTAAVAHASELDGVAGSALRTDSTPPPSLARERKHGALFVE